MTAENKSRREVEQLKVEKASLLDELEMSYRNLEEVLSTAHSETGIAYAILWTVLGGDLAVLSEKAIRR